MSISYNTKKMRHTSWTKNDFFKESETYMYLGGWEGGSPIKIFVPLTYIPCYITKHKHTNIKFLIIKSIHVELLKS